MLVFFSTSSVFFSVALFDDNWVKDILVARYSHFFLLFEAPNIYVAV